MPTYTNNTPQAGDTIAFTQPLIQDNFLYLEDVIDVDHNFTGTSPTATDGYHKVTHHITQGGDPAPIAGVLQSYSKVAGGLEQFFAMDGTGNISNLTQANLAINGGFQWVGRCLIQWGRSVSPTGVIGPVTFPTPFPTACLNVMTTPAYTGATATSNAPSSPTTAHVYYNNTPSPTTTEFRVSFQGSSNSTAFYWVAIGY